MHGVIRTVCIPPQLAKLGMFPKTHKPLQETGVRAFERCRDSYQFSIAWKTAFPEICANSDRRFAFHLRDLILGPPKTRNSRKSVQQRKAHSEVSQPAAKFRQHASNPAQPLICALSISQRNLRNPVLVSIPGAATYCVL